MKPEFLKGIMPALLTGFTDDLTAIDITRTRKLVRFLVDSGVHGLYVGGSSGEMLLCSVEERKTLLEAVLAETQKKVTVIAHIGATGTRETCELAAHAEKAGADALSSVTPLYFAYSFADVKQYYVDITKASSLPVIIYNVPARTGMTLNYDQLHELLEIPGVAGMKFTASDFYQLERLRTGHPNHVFYNGSDEMLLSGLAAGADGGIGTTYNFQPDRMLKIYELYQQGKMQEALAVQSQANEIISAVLKYGVMPACKELLKIGGLDYGTCRKPFRPLAEEYKAPLAADAAANLGENFMIR
ncbi:MAG: N-acetylneuraminate lyase [Clostridia bacterium]|nr:N-acetylneuraminate lyase [Clostridia bacterium]